MADSDKKKSRLANALRDAAVENIGEDIADILNTLDNIINNLPPKIRAQVETINNEVVSLRRALNAIPDEFDREFTKKMNRIFSQQEDLEQSIASFNKQLATDVSRSVISKVEKSLSKKNRLSPIGIFAMCLSCTIAGILGSTLFFWLLFKSSLIG